jgi:DNA polymerase-3 subunit epsilon
LFNLLCILFAIIDIETTGGTPVYERITEIAIVLHDGKRVIDTFSTLINPERNIPWNITQLTGISNEMVAEAPRFHEVARKIVEMTESAVFVAHNVQFDYGFIKAEFSRLGYAYSRKTLCTVRLSRRVFPGLRSYSLSNLKLHFGILAEKSHRALDDTLATVQLFEKILDAEGEESIRATLHYGIRESKLPEGIRLSQLEAVPEACGVYYLHNSQGEVIYVGKSLNMRKRLMEHFADPTSKGEKLRAGVADFSFEVTGSELAALLLESAEIKRLQPSINKAQRMKQFSGGIFKLEDENGYWCLAVGKKSAKKSKGLELVADYPKLEHAKLHLESIRRQFELCNRLCHLDFGEGACFYYTIKQCRGGCVGEETASEYNLRVSAALAQLRKGLTGSFLIVEEGRSAVEKTIIAIEEGIYKGFAWVDTDMGGLDKEELVSLVSTKGEDPEATRIICGYLDRLDAKKKSKIIRIDRIIG